MKFYWNKISNLSRLIPFMLVLSSLLSCRDEEKKIVLYYSVNEPMGKIALTIRDILESELNVEIETVIGEGSLKDLDKLRKGDGHLVLVENHVGFQRNVKSLMPIYPQILHVFYKNEEEILDFRQVLEGKRIFMGHLGDGSYRFAEQLIDYFDIDKSSFTITENPFESDVLIGFTDIIADEDLSGLSGYSLFSFDNVTQFGLGSKVEGMALKYPRTRPFIIPEDTYIQLTKNPILTLASDVVLVTSEDLSNELAYDITKAIFRNLQEFTHISPLISQDLNEDFNRSSLSYPLHNGARIYLDRDEPTFLERYAELAGVGFSITLALLSGAYSLSKWIRQRKKDRIDVFYQDLMKIKKLISKLSGKKHVIDLINKIRREQQKAFNMLVNEELEANESFRIYMELSKETIDELRLKYRRL